MVLTSAALLLEVITKVLRLILSQMINRKQLSRSLKLKSLNLFQTQYSWAKCHHRNSKFSIKWRTVFKTRWLTLITTKVECLNNISNSNMEQPWQVMANSSNSLVACHSNKISSKQDITRIRVSTKHTVINSPSNNTTKRLLWEARAHSMPSAEQGSNSNNTNSNLLSNRQRLHHLICSEWWLSTVN